MSIEERVQQVAARLRQHPEFMALLLKTLCGDDIRVAGPWKRDHERALYRLPNLSHENHNIAIVFDPDMTGQPFKWLVYGLKGSPLHEGGRPTAGEAKFAAEKAARDLGVILTAPTQAEWTTTKWFFGNEGKSRVIRVQLPADDGIVLAEVMVVGDKWQPSVPGSDLRLRLFHRLQDALKVCDDILEAGGHVLPPGSVAGIEDILAQEIHL